MIHPHPIIDDLKAERQRRGMSAAVAAERAGISQSAIYRWEEGGASPRLAELAAYAAALGYALALSATGRRP